MSHPGQSTWSLAGTTAKNLAFTPIQCQIVTTRATGISIFSHNSKGAFDMFVPQIDRRIGQGAGAEMRVFSVDFNFVDQLVDSFAELGRDVGDVVPRLIVALLILLVGHWIAKLIRRLLTKLLDRVGADRLTEAAGMEPMLQQAGTSGVKIIGQVAYFLIFLVFIQISAEVLGIEQLTELLTDLIAYLPLVLVALLVFFVAAAIANWASNVVRPFAVSRNMGWVASAVRIGVLVVGILAALDTLKFAPSVTDKIENTLLQFLPLAILVAGVIAFGIGGIDTAKQWWRKLAPRPDGNEPTSRQDTPPSF